MKSQGAPPSELHVYPLGGHGYGRCTIGESKELAGAEICNWPERAAAFARAMGFAPKAQAPDAASVASISVRAPSVFE